MRECCNNLQSVNLFIKLLRKKKLSNSICIIMNNTYDDEMMKKYISVFKLFDCLPYTFLTVCMVHKINSMACYVKKKFQKGRTDIFIGPYRPT